MIELKIRKIAELPYAKHKGQPEVGFEITIKPPMKILPEVGHRFPYAQADWFTDLVADIIDDKSFITLTSIYEYEYEEYD